MLSSLPNFGCFMSQLLGGCAASQVLYGAYPLWCFLGHNDMNRLQHTEWTPFRFESSLSAPLKGTQAPEPAMVESLQGSNLNKTAANQP